MAGHNKGRAKTKPKPIASPRKKAGAPAKPAPPVTKGGVVSLEKIQKNRLIKFREVVEENDARILADLSRRGEEAAAVAAVLEVEDAAGVDGEKKVNAGAESSVVRRAFGGALRQAIREADVIIEVLDARDPEGYRTRSVEQEIIMEGKTLVLLINKIDLVKDQQVVRAWQKHFQKEFPCVTFRSMTTPSRNKKSTAKFHQALPTSAPTAVLHSGHDPLGAHQLMDLLKNYTRIDRLEGYEAAAPEPAPEAMDENEEEDGKNTKPAAAPTLFRNIVVAIIGMPNVGKSSVINSLARNTSKVKTGNEPGVTRQIGRIRLTQNIQLLDTPGVIMEAETADAATVLRGCIKNPSEGEIMAACQLLLATQGVKEQLPALYGVSEAELEALSSLDELLALIAVRRRLLTKGGGRDLAAAANALIADWQRGRITAFATPPESSAPATASAAKIVTGGPSAPLDLDQLLAGAMP